MIETTYPEGRETGTLAQAFPALNKFVQPVVGFLFFYSS